MSRSWPYLSAVAVVGVLAGTAIGGKPVARDEFVISPDQIPTTTVAADDTVTSVPSASALPTPVTTTTSTATTTTSTSGGSATGSATTTTTATTSTGGAAGAADGTDVTG
ncbi:MAG: hypothetical protein JWN62_1899 [Acidimicrobiales bacterium]|nr:hypothetical protein [Acidimicrobiales bacterium]